MVLLPPRYKGKFAAAQLVLAICFTKHVANPSKHDCGNNTMRAKLRNRFIIWASSRLAVAIVLYRHGFSP